MDTIAEISLDVDHTYKETTAQKHDGYIETAAAVTHLAPFHAFPDTKGKPVHIHFSDLFTMPTPPTPSGDHSMCVVKFLNDFLPISAYTEGPENRQDYGRVTATTLARVRRQSAVQDASAKANAKFSELFLILAIAMGVIGVVSLFVILVLTAFVGNSGA